jgi:hypothetical protein
MTDLRASYEALKAELLASVSGDVWRVYDAD